MEKKKKIAFVLPSDPDKFKDMYPGVAKALRQESEQEVKRYDDLQKLIMDTFYNLRRHGPAILMAQREKIIVLINQNDYDFLIYYSMRNVTYACTGVDMSDPYG